MAQRGGSISLRYCLVVMLSLWALQAQADDSSEELDGQRQAWSGEVLEYLRKAEQALAEDSSEEIDGEQQAWSGDVLEDLRQAGSGEALDGTRIVNGISTSTEKFPWMVYIRSDNMSEKYYHNCGATIISDMWILSAAHCFTEILNNNNGWKIDRNRIRGYPGVSDRRDRDYGLQNFVLYENDIKTHLHIHPNYTKEYKRNNDMALIQLKKPLKFSSTIQKIDLGTTNELIPGKEVVVSGWGSTENGKSADILQYVDGIRLISQDDCIKKWGSQRIKDSMVCTQTSGTCKGDSGGPLFTGRDSSSSPPYVLIGVTSWGGRGCYVGNTVASVYASVPALSTWIKETMSTAVINGGWTAWSPVSECSTECQQTQTRSCTNPSPNGGGTDCTGDTTRVGDCTGTGSCSICVNKYKESYCQKYADRDCNAGERQDWMAINCMKTCKKCSINSSKCSTPWTSIGKNNKCFLFVDDKLDWDDARVYCQNKGGDLAMLDVKSKRKELVDYMDVSGWKDDGGSRWLGANIRSGTWRWMDNSTVELTSGWRSGEPDRYWEANYCMYLYPSYYLQGNDLLSDTRCSKKKRFICEK